MGRRRRRHFQQPLSDEDYVQSNGSVCPNCRSTQITGHQLEPTDVQVFYSITCDDCEAEWTEVYQMIGYSDLNLNEENNDVQQLQRRVDPGGRRSDSHGAGYPG